MFKMMVVPDYMPDQFSAWYLLNTHLQKNLALNIGLVLPESFAEVAQLQKAAPAAMIYANPFDAGHYVREQGQRGIAGQPQPFHYPHRQRLYVAVSGSRIHFAYHHHHPRCQIRLGIV